MELLNKLTNVDGTSGNECEIRDVIKKEIENHCDDITIDAMGNLIAHISGNGKKIMFAAHMDEVGIVVTHIDKNGFISFRNIGGIKAHDLVGRRVRFNNGVIGVIGCTKDFINKPEFDKLYIDTNKADNIHVGDMAAFCGATYTNGKSIISKALDDRIGCYVLISAIQELNKTDNDLYFVFTVQEEIGLRGAKTSAFTINPDYAVTVDVTATGDTPEADVMDVSLGKGTAIKVMDKSIICDAYIRSKMIETAKQKKIPYQIEILTIGGSDAGAIHLTRAGIKTGGVSVPVRYVHSPSEMADYDDIKSCCKLVNALIQSEWE